MARDSARILAVCRSPSRLNAPGISGDGEPHHAGYRAIDRDDQVGHTRGSSRHHTWFASATARTPGDDLWIPRRAPRSCMISLRKRESSKIDHGSGHFCREIRPLPHEQGESRPMAANTPKPNRSSRTRANQKLVEGFNKHQALLTQLVIDGEVLTVAQLVSRIEEIIATANRAEEARAAFLAAAQADLASRRKQRPVSRQGARGIARRLLESPRCARGLRSHPGASGRRRPSRAPPRPRSRASIARNHGHLGA